MKDHEYRTPGHGPWGVLTVGVGGGWARREQ